MSNKAQFRIVLAELMLAREVFNGIITKPNFSDLTGLDKFFNDGGFYYLAARPIKVLARPRTIDESVCKALQDKTLEFGTIFLNKELLKEAEERDLKKELEEAKKEEDLVRLDLYDTLVYKEIQSTFIAFDNGNNKFFDFSSSLDDIQRTIMQEMAPAYSYGFVTTDTITLMSEILNLDTETGIRAGLDIMRSDTNMSKYAATIQLMAQHGI